VAAPAVKKQNWRRDNVMRYLLIERGANAAINRRGKYPPAKPGALGIGPLKAAVGDADASPISLAA